MDALIHWYTVKQDSGDVYMAALINTSHLSLCMKAQIRYINIVIVPLSFLSLTYLLLTEFAKEYWEAEATFQLQLWQKPASVIT